MGEETTDDVYGGSFLKTSDLPRDGSAMEFTIKTVKVDSVGKGDDTKKKILLALENSDKVFVVNKTNAERLAKNFKTPAFKNWAGKKFKLKRGDTQFQGKDTEGMRVVKEYDD